MSHSKERRDPTPWLALAVSLGSLAPTLATLGLQFRTGPQAVLYYIAQVGGPFQFGLLVVGSGLCLVAHVRTGFRRDPRLIAAWCSLAASVIGLVIFMVRG